MLSEFIFLGLALSRTKAGVDSLEGLQREEGASCCALKYTSTFPLATSRNAVAVACLELSTTPYFRRTTAVGGQGS